MTPDARRPTPDASRATADARLPTPGCRLEVTGLDAFYGRAQALFGIALDVAPGPYRGDFRGIWKEARRVFDHPDFGPPVLPEEGDAARAAS